MEIKLVVLIFLLISTALAIVIIYRSPKIDRYIPLYDGNIGIRDVPSGDIKYQGGCKQTYGCK